MTVMEPQGCEISDGWDGWEGPRDVMWRRTGTQGPEDTRTYETFSGRPRLRCAPASQRCPLASWSTGARCPAGFRGPARPEKEKEGREDWMEKWREKKE